MLVDDDPQVGGATTTKEEEPMALNARARAVRMVEDFMLRLILILEQEQRAATQRDKHKLRPTCTTELKVFNSIPRRSCNGFHRFEVEERATKREHETREDLG